MPVDALVAAVRSGLVEVADPAKAPGMQAYMKSTMPFLGVQKTPRAAVLKLVFNDHQLADRNEWEAAVRELWHGATYREERYAAIALTGHRSARPYQDRETLPLYRELIVDGAWWDYVDELASNRVGPILRADRHHVEPLIRTWSTDPDKWLRRTAILSQLTFKADTDLALLADVIEPNLTDRDFFLRKAIGWALRQYAWTDPGWVRAYVDAHEDRLSPLSRREALKNM
ncbi:DNA alkylation repair protein [Cryptosporangium aurantiacum]|uniref:3-methyladenine DNA glycosylase AlkD n=1 Tax=Cryptosporangium aurantiacum TaxID=134849 RepID=A0A1M7RP33_9ACTN|nr:DNA alkylation repair protein [Cryptosporangium aurantiacum]SHN47961.1 3-methyladenine DNA glycosylase AlkD [Cryptosporangium aurantiacum]